MLLDCFVSVWREYVDKIKATARPPYQYCEAQMKPPTFNKYCAVNEYHSHGAPDFEILMQPRISSGISLLPTSHSCTQAISISTSAGERIGS